MSAHKYAKRNMIKLTRPKWLSYMKRSYEHHRTNESSLLNVELQTTYIYNSW